MYCSNCGSEMNSNAAVCVKCGFSKGSGKNYCQNCGKPIIEGQAMCTNCGSYIESAPTNGTMPVTPDVALNTVLQKLNTSYTIWLIVGICQIIFGFWYITPIFFGIWNIIAASNRKKLIEQYKKDPAGLVKTVKSWKDSMILFIILNAILGALVGIAGGIYDYTITSYVEQNERELVAAGA